MKLVHRRGKQNSNWDLHTHNVNIIITNSSGENKLRIAIAFLLQKK